MVSHDAIIRAAVLLALVLGPVRGAAQPPGAESNGEPALPQTGSTTEATPPRQLSLVQAPDEDLAARELTLAEALARAEAASPVLGASRAALGAAAARSEQAGRWPNPELVLSSEGFAGSGELAGFDGAESSLEVTQPLPIGQPARQRAVADAERARVAAAVAAAAADVVAEVGAAFHRTLAAQHRVELAGELVRLAERVETSVAARVEAGKAPPAEGARARVPLAEARILLAGAREELAAARRSLAATWGDTHADFVAVHGDLEAIEPPPAPAELLARLAATAELAAGRADIERGAAQLELERRAAWPELALTVGRRREEASRASGWSGGLAVELPVFDRNRAAVRAAELEVAQARHGLEAIRASAAARLAGVHAEVAAAYAAARLHVDDAVPAAGEAFRAVEIAYREGKLGLLDVLDAQRTLFETRLGLLAALERYHLARTELERLTAPAPVDRLEIVGDPS